MKQKKRIPIKLDAETEALLIQRGISARNPISRREDGSFQFGETSEDSIPPTDSATTGESPDS